MQREIPGGYLRDNRHGKNIQPEMKRLLSQSVYSRLEGYKDIYDAEGLRKDPEMRTVIGNRTLEKHYEKDKQSLSCTWMIKKKLFRNTN
jgi:hypothetical protein